MYIGQLIREDASLYSPWFPREADNAYFTYEEIDKSGTSPTLTVKVFHKNTEEPGPGAELTSTFSAIGSTNFKSANLEGLKEMVRFRFSTTSTAGWLVIRMLAPTWYDTADAT